jgi:hypothetical protein
LSGTGKPRHPTLQKFLIEASLYKYVGMNLDDLRHRPHQEMLDYITICGLISQEEERQNAKMKADSERKKR